MIVDYYVFPFMNIILTLLYLLCVRRHRGLIILILCQVLMAFLTVSAGPEGSTLLSHFMSIIWRIHETVILVVVAVVLLLLNIRTRDAR